MLTEAGQSDGFCFDRTALRQLARARREGFATARPYPHAVVDGLLGDVTKEPVDDRVRIRPRRRVTFPARAGELPQGRPVEAEPIALARLRQHRHGIARACDLRPRAHLLETGELRYPRTRADPCPFFLCSPALAVDPASQSRDRAPVAHAGLGARSDAEEAGANVPAARLPARDGLALPALRERG